MDKVDEHFRLKAPYETVEQRWRRVPLRLHTAGLIDSEAEPHLCWDQMRELIAFRNGLVHGKASLPSGLKDRGDRSPPPEPTVEQLRRRGQGWALDSVLEVVGQLHKQTGTPVPTYVEDHLDPV